MTVENALKRLRHDARDAEAWQAIAKDAYQPTLAYVASLLLTFNIGAAESADDIVHEVLVRFYERWPNVGGNIESRESLHSYLRISCRNLLVDRYRRERSARRFVDFSTLKFNAAFQDDTDIYRSIFLEEIVGLLEGECAELFKQYVSGDDSLAEIAERMHVSPATFYSKWYRCIQRAREILVKRKGLLKR